MSRGAVGEGPKNPTKRTIEDVAGFDGPRDQWDRPLILPEGSTKGRGVGYTRASSLGGMLESEFALGQWRARMAVWGLARRKDLIVAAAAIDDPNETQKKELGEVCDAALEAAETQGAARLGTALHAVTQKIDAGIEIPDLFDEHRPALEAYARKMALFEIHASEMFVVSEAYRTAGTFDRLVSPSGWMRAPDGTAIGPGDRLILDLKTSRSADYFGIKFAVQLTVYARSRPYRHPGRYLDWPGGVAPRTDWGLILWVPSDGTIAELFWVSLERGHDLALLAIEVREWRRNKHLVVPADDPSPEDWSPGLHAVPDPEPRPAEVVQHHVDTVREQIELDRTPSPETILSAIRGATSQAALVALYERTGTTWGDEHRAAADARLAELTP